MIATKQPSGLKVLFFAELWERFGFYTIQSLLVLYLVKVFLFSDTKAYGLFSAFSALIYTTPVIGGYLADKFLGYRAAIILGAVLYIVGYFLLGIPHNPFFYEALAFLIWGNGFFKSSVSSFLGTLYHENDIRRDSGFTIFYMGINIGSFLAPIVCTAIALRFGWNYGFATAGLGMVIGLINCLWGFKQHFHENGFPPHSQILSKKFFYKFSNLHVFMVALILALILTSYLMNFQNLVNYGLIVFSILTMLFILLKSFAYKGQQRQKLWALIILIIFSIVFWSLYMQTFLSITLFINRNVDRHFFDWMIPTAMFQSINPFFIIVLSPLFAKLWIVLGKKKKDFSAPTKFALGIFFIGLGFLGLGTSIEFGSHAGIISSIFVIGLFFLQTCGELSLSPVGLSAVTQLAPKDLTGMLMGVWFLALAAAYAVAGKIADLTAIPEKIDTSIHSAQIYAHNFLVFGLLAIVSALVLFLLVPFLKRMIEA